MGIKINQYNEYFLTLVEAHLRIVRQVNYVQVIMEIRHFGNDLEIAKKFISGSAERNHQMRITLVSLYYDLNNNNNKLDSYVTLKFGTICDYIVK